MSEDDYKLCRKNIIECVLGTDMTLHNKKYLAFKEGYKRKILKKEKILIIYLIIWTQLIHII